MDIGIIVYSQTGNTYEVAERLKERLRRQGHSVNLDRVTIEGKASSGTREVKFTHVPGVKGYEHIIFGSPVHAFSLPVPTRAYLEQLPSLEGKESSLFVTKQLPFKWTGGTQTLGMMEKLCRAKGATVKMKEIVFWRGKQREEKIVRCMENLSKQFT